MEDNAKERAVVHTIYSKIIGCYLLVNGLLALGLALWIVLQEPQYTNQITFGITAIIFPCVSSLLGYYLLIGERWAFRYVLGYLLAAIPIFGIDTWQYTHAHGMSIHFEVRLFGLLLGVNTLPMLGIWLLARHFNLTRRSSKDAA